VVALDGSNRHDHVLDLVGTGRVRVGLVMNSMLLYATGGGAWTMGRVTRFQIVGTVGAAVPATVEQADVTRFGWSAGGGVEWGFAPNWTVRGEALYLGLGRTNYTFPLAGRTTSSTLNVTEARVALNYKFNLWGTPASVAARY